MISPTYHPPPPQHPFHYISPPSSSTSSPLHLTPPPQHHLSYISPPSSSTPSLLHLTPLLNIISPTSNPPLLDTISPTSHPLLLLAIISQSSASLHHRLQKCCLPLTSAGFDRLRGYASSSAGEEGPYRMPVVPLKQSCERLLESVKPLLADAQYDSATKVRYIGIGV